MNIEIPWLHEWPRCYYDPERFCGDTTLGGLNGNPKYTPHEPPKSWHVADFCNCPSCPIRCAVRDGVSRAEKERAPVSEGS